MRPKYYIPDLASTALRSQHHLMGDGCLYWHTSKYPGNLMLQPLPQLSCSKMYVWKGNTTQLEAPARTTERVPRRVDSGSSPAGSCVHQERVLRHLGLRRHSRDIHPLVYQQSSRGQHENGWHNNRNMWVAGYCRSKGWHTWQSFPSSCRIAVTTIAKEA